MLERRVATGQPRLHALGGHGAQLDERAAAVGGVLAALDETVILEIARQLARRRQRHADSPSDLADRLRAFGADVGEHADMTPAERRVARDESQELARRAPARPEATHHAPQLRPKLCQLLIGYHQITIIESEWRG